MVTRGIISVYPRFNLDSYVVSTIPTCEHQTLIDTQVPPSCPRMRLPNGKSILRSACTLLCSALPLLLSRVDAVA